MMVKSNPLIRLFIVVHLAAGCILASSGRSYSQSTEIQQAETDATLQDSIKLGRFATPKWIMIRSLVIPGWGQWHNEKYIKSAVIFSIEAALLSTYFVYDNKLNNETDPNLIIKTKDDRNKYAWLFAASALYAMADAFVDAYLRDFDANMNINVSKNLEKAEISLHYNFSLGSLFKRRKQ